MSHFEIENIENISNWSGLGLWINQLLCGPYKKTIYSLPKDYQLIIALIQDIDQFILLQNNPLFKTHNYYIYQYHYHLPSNWFKLTFYSYSQTIYGLYQNNQLIIYSKIPNLLDNLFYNHRTGL